MKQRAVLSMNKTACYFRFSSFEG